MPPPRKAIDYFVPRDEAVRLYDERLDRPGMLVVGDLEGPYGIGKTTLLAHLYERAATRRPDARRAWGALAQFELPEPAGEPGESGELGEDEEAQLHRRSDAQQVYKRLLVALAADLLDDPEEHARFTAELDQAYDDALASALKHFNVTVQAGSVHVGPLAWISGSTLKAGDASARVDLPALAERRHAFGQAREHATQLFAGRANALAANGQVLIFLDDFCHIQETVLEDWLLRELIPACRQCTFLLGRTNLERALTPIEDLRTPLPIGGFSPEETRDYVAQLLGPGALALHWDRRVHQFCQGNPLVTALLVELLKSSHVTEGGEISTWSFIPSLKTGERQRLETLAQQLVQRMGSRQPPLGEAIDVACVLREFDAGLLDHVLGGQVAGDELAGILDRLRRLPVVEDRGEVLAVHELFANARESWLQARAPERVVAAHRRAAEYYGAQMHAEEDETSARGVWERWHRFEDAEWQYRSRRWLYHLAALPDAGLEIATRYFDAFFWWAEFIPFPYCERLIQDLRRAPLAPEAREWVALLRRHHAGFAPVRRRGAGADWAPGARRTLRAIQRQAGLHRSIADDDAVRWHLKGITEYYLGDTYRVQDPNRPDAEAAYRESIAALEAAEAVHRRGLEGAGPASASERRILETRAENEAWCRAWSRLRLAGLLVDRGEPLAGLTACDEAEAAIRAADPEDYENLALIEQTRGAAHLATGDAAAALRAHALYALYAARFLIDEYGSGGDLYTLEFLRETIETIAARWIALQASDPARAAEWWPGLLAFWGDEGRALLPAELGHPPADLHTAIELDTVGHVLAHRLPLPRLPLAAGPAEAAARASATPALNFDPGYAAEIDDAFRTLIARHLESSLEETP